MGMNYDAQGAHDTAAAPPNEIRVAIIEDETRIREGLGVLIDLAEGFRCASQFASMEEAIEKIGADLPDVALVDIGLPGMSGIQGIRLLKERHPDLRLVMLTVYDDDERIFEALCAGAVGYLLKKTAPSDCWKASKKLWPVARRCRRRWRAE